MADVPITTLAPGPGRAEKKGASAARGGWNGEVFFLTLAGWAISMNLVFLGFRSPRDQGDVHGFSLLSFRPDSSFRLAAIVGACRGLVTDAAFGKHRRSRGSGSWTAGDGQGAGHVRDRRDSSKNGDDLAAKRTVLQIGEEHDSGPSDVVAVCCFDGQIFYDHPPGCRCPAPFSPRLGSYRFGWGGFDSQGNQYFLNRDRAGDHVPSKCPPGLRRDYLDPDPHHGPLVDFSDEHDSRGTRITSRKYADGYVVIETPQPGRK